MIHRLLASYIRPKRGILSGPPEPPPLKVPLAAEPRYPSPLDLPPTDHQKSEGQQSLDIDATMAESTVAFGKTMCLNDLDGGGITPPPFAASVRIPADLAKAIDEDLKPSSGVLEDPERVPMV